MNRLRGAIIVALVLALAGLWGCGSSGSTNTEPPMEQVGNNDAPEDKGEQENNATNPPDEEAEDASDGHEEDAGNPDVNEPVESPGPYQHEEMTFGADSLPGTFSAPEGALGVPAVLLLHQLNSTREEWTRYLVVEGLESYNVAYLAVDLRGHGASPAGGKSWREFGAADWAKLPGDAADALAWLRERPEVDPDNISIVGGSIGANTALLAFASDARVRSGAFLSPGLPDYRGLDISSALEEGSGERAAIVVGSRGDSSRAADAEELAGRGPNIEAVVLDGGGHGARQLGESEEVRARVVKLLATGVDE